MLGIKQRYLGLCLAPSLFCLCDAGITLCGQLSEYWSGNIAAVIEGTPAWRQLLQIHPAAFMIGILVWIAVFNAMILLLPEFLAFLFSTFIAIAHLSGAFSWLLLHPIYASPYARTAFEFGSAFFLVVCIRWGWKARPTGVYDLKNVGSKLRWGLLSFLIGVCFVFFSWPRNSSTTGLAEEAEKTLAAAASSDHELEGLADNAQIVGLSLLGDQITAEGLAHLEKLPHLQQLTLYGVHLTQEGLICIGKIESLQDLKLREVIIDDADLAGLASLTSLRSISLSGNTVTDAWLKPLIHFREIQSLYLSGLHLTDEGLKFLQGMTRLNTLHLCGTSMRDGGLHHLKSLSQLEYLTLYDMAITDAGLENLQPLANLKQLTFNCTNVTPEGKKKLQKTLPGCKISGS